MDQEPSQNIVQQQPRPIQKAKPKKLNLNGSHSFLFLLEAASASSRETPWPLLQITDIKPFQTMPPPTKFLPIIWLFYT